MEFKKLSPSKVIKKAINRSLKTDANSTSCIMVYQPKPPAALKKFSKIENDK